MKKICILLSSLVVLAATTGTALADQRQGHHRAGGHGSGDHRYGEHRYGSHANAQPRSAFAITFRSLAPSAHRRQVHGGHIGQRHHQPQTWRPAGPRWQGQHYRHHRASKRPLPAWTVLRMLGGQNYWGFRDMHVKNDRYKVWACDNQGRLFKLTVDRYTGRIIRRRQPH